MHLGVKAWQYSSGKTLIQKGLQQTMEKSVVRLSNPVIQENEYTKVFSEYLQLRLTNWLDLNWFYTIFPNKASQIQRINRI